MNKTPFQEGWKSMAEFKICRNEALGEVSLIGQPAKKSRSANYPKASDEYPTFPAKYFERRCQIIHKRKQKHFYSLIPPQNTIMQN